MKDITKAQIAVGLLSFFATIWRIALNQDYSDIANAMFIIVVQFVAIMVLSYVLITILEWVDTFDLQTNSILTLVVNVTILAAMPLI
jgi:hypothetical protein